MHRLLSNRPVDVWMHEQDIRRAIGRPGGYSSPAAAHVMGVFGQALPMVGRQARRTPVGTTSPWRCPTPSWPGLSGSARTVGRPVADAATPTTTVRLSPEDFVVLAGGRRTPEATDAEIEGDEDLGHRLLRRWQ